MCLSFCNVIEEKRILILGLDAAGKTTILYQLNLGEAPHTIPTVGFNVESFEYKNINFSAFDIGGQKKIRALWNYYYDSCDALIYVIDSSDTERIQEANEELSSVINDDRLRNIPVLVYANKQDLPQAMTPGTIYEKMKETLRNRNFLVQGCTATTGKGLYDGLDWLSKALTEEEAKNYKRGNRNSNTSLAINWP